MLHSLNFGLLICREGCNGAASDPRRLHLLCSGIGSLCFSWHLKSWQLRSRACPCLTTTSASGTNYYRFFLRRKIFSFFVLSISSCLLCPLRWRTLFFLLNLAKGQLLLLFWLSFLSGKWWWCLSTCSCLAFEGSNCLWSKLQSLLSLEYISVPCVFRVCVRTNYHLSILQTLVLPMLSIYHLSLHQWQHWKAMPDALQTRIHIHYPTPSWYSLQYAISQAKQL